MSFVRRDRRGSVRDIPRIRLFVFSLSANIGQNDLSGGQIVLCRAMLFLIFFSRFPDVYFRFGAVFESYDVFSVCIEQQDGRDEREDHERDRVVYFWGGQRKDREAASGDHRGQRYVVGHDQNDGPYGEAKQDDRGVDSRDSSHERCDPLTSAESGEDWEYMSQYGCKYGDDFEVNQPHVGDKGIVFEYFDQCNSDKSFQKIEDENRKSRASPQDA